ncbi:tripartite tricarboxylate transporter permease, partial [Candidatus Woesearchaeota archaeon]|nr:tripartite tricarboxylate transporter permease [Candidatus Woesearchaeota archaeon]
HVNLVAVSLIYFLPLLLNYFLPLSLAVVIVSVAITHTFLDSIPSIFLGAPEPDTILSVLPGHRLLMKGEGYRGVMLTVFGSLCSLILIILFIPVLVFVADIGYPVIEKFIGLILVLISIFLVMREKRWWWALTSFFVSGTFGLIVLNMPTLKDPLLPMLSGLFGISNLIISLNGDSYLPKQKITPLNMKKWTACKAFLGSLSSGSICSFLPGIGPSQAAIIASQFFRKLGDGGFLILVGGLSMVNTIMGFVTFFSLGKARNGAVVAVSRILNNFRKEEFLIIICVSLVVGGIAVFLASIFAKKAASLINKVDYKKMSLVVILFIFVLVLLISNFLGAFILIIATFIGILPARKGIGKNHLMGSLILPVIAYFLF